MTFWRPNWQGVNTLIPFFFLFLPQVATFQMTSVVRGPHFSETLCFNNSKGRLGAWKYLKDLFLMGRERKRRKVLDNEWQWLTDCLVLTTPILIFNLEKKILGFRNCFIEFWVNRSGKREEKNSIFESNPELDTGRGAEISMERKTFRHRPTHRAQGVQEETSNFSDFN